MLLKLITLKKQTDLQKRNNLQEKEQIIKKIQYNVQRQSIEFQLNNFYAVAFTDRWYPGLCIEIIDEQTAFF